MVTNESTNEHKYEKVPVNEITKDDKENDTKEKASYGFGVRHMQALLIFTCLIINFVARGHLGVTIVAMVDIPQNNTEAIVFNETNTETDTNSTNTHIIGVEVELEDTNVTKSNTTDDLSLNINSTVDSDSVWNVYKKYQWPKSVQEMVLGSFFLGYLIMMFPMGMVIQRWGGKLAFQIALFVNGIVSILTPWIVAWGGWKGACFCRILQGLSQTGLYPGVITLLAAWVPSCERASFSSYVFTGTTVGTVVAFQLAGFLSSTSWGWPSMFWMAGILCIITLIVITFFMAAYPQEHTFISDREKMFISGHLNAGVTKVGRTPWKSAMTSKHVWAIYAAHIGNGTTFFFIFTQVASYLHYILKVDVKKSGILSSLPYMANFCVSICVGFLSDFLTNRKILTIKTTRRLFNTISATGLSLSLAALSFTTSTTAAVAFLMLAMASHAGSHTGWMVNYMDICPNFSGALVGTGNTLMNVFIVTLPVLVSNIVVDVTNPYQWRVVLFLVAGLGFLCNVVFVAFMSTDVQPWNEPKLAENDQEDKELADLKEDHLPVVPE